MTLPAAANIVVSIQPSSTSSQLDLVITGTVAASDYGNRFFDDPFPKLYIYKDTLEWTNTSISNSHQNPLDGASLNAPSIEIADFRTQITSNGPFGAAPQDYFVLEWAPNDGGNYLPDDLQEISKSEGLLVSKPFGPVENSEP